ncbi:MAG: D-glycerate dehydrogenase [Anaerolineae bacterium]|nr:D-glycerate dehydrogenase [Anaerolineae bacterium]
MRSDAEGETIITRKVFVTRIIPGLERLQAVCDADIWQDEMTLPYDVLRERVRAVDGILSMLTDRIDSALMDAAGSSLKVISQMAVGYDNIDVNAARQRGIVVGNTPGVLTETTADLAFALLLAAARRLQEGARYIQDGKWITWHPTTLLGHDVTGATLGIVGLGRIGTAVAQRAAGFDMRILAYGRHLSDEAAAQAGAQRVSLEELLSQSDFVSLHCPLTPETRHLINRETLAQMKPSAILINTTRGPVVDQTALYEALISGVIAGAALDVTDPEPLPADDPILALPNALVVPHVGSATIGTRGRMAQIAIDNLIAGITGQPLLHAVGA